VIFAQTSFGRLARVLAIAALPLVPAAALDTACTQVTGSSGVPTVYLTPPAATISDGNGHTLAKFVGPTDPGGGGFVVTISGEVNALSSYPFPPFDPSQTWMVDGWNWRIDKYIVVIDHVVLWADPNLSATNQSLHGGQVAHADGPFVVDLHKGGPLAGVGGGGEEALALTTLANQNDNGGASFDPTVTYGFGFSTVQAPADYSAINVNLDETEAADYAYMAEGGFSVLYEGTATWAGNQTGTASGFNGTCTQTTTNAPPVNEGDDGGAGDGGVAGGGYDFSKLPQTMTFKLGFSTPTNYVNCVNYTVSVETNTTVRGVQTSPSQSVIAQVTVHMDHPFWESFAENSPVHWDQIAAQYIGVDNPEAQMKDLVGVPFDPFTDKLGNVMPWRSCAPASLYTPPSNGAMSFSTLDVPQNPKGVCTGVTGVDSSKDNCPAIRDYYDYIRYTQSTQGHLNSQGLCYIDRQFPAPAGGS
jgi:hypothetical protein